MSKANNADESAEDSTDEYDLPLPGLVAVDVEDESKGVIVALTGKTAEEERVAATGKTIAEHNPDHPEDAPTAVMVYKGELEERWGERWQEWPASMLTYKVGNEGMRTYSFPVTRLVWGEGLAPYLDEDAELTEELPEAPEAGAYVACAECDFSAEEGDTKADYAVHFEECPECGGELETAPEEVGE